MSSAGVVQMCRGSIWIGLMGFGLNSPHIYSCFKTNKLIARLFRCPGYIANMDMTLEHKRSMCRRRGGLNGMRIDLDGSYGDWIEFTT